LNIGEFVGVSRRGESQHRRCRYESLLHVGSLKNDRDTYAPREKRDDRVPDGNPARASASACAKFL
jgi:hypothetical protein